MRNAEIAFTRKRRTCKTRGAGGTPGQGGTWASGGSSASPRLPGPLRLAGRPLQECVQDRTSFGVFADLLLPLRSHMGVDQLAGLFLPNTWLRGGVGAVLERGLP